MFELCPHTTQRFVTHKGHQRDVNNVKSCFKVLNEAGENIPCFVSHHLDELRPVTFKGLDVSCLLGKIDHRSFNANSYEKYTWIGYSKEQDVVFCKACRHFLEMHTETTFTRGYCKNWKRLGDVCDKHESSKLHAIALTKLASFRSSHGPQSHGTVLNQLHGHAPAFVERNWEHAKVVLDIAMMGAKLEIPLRGHRETNDTLNKGNFLELFKFVSKYASEIETQLEELPQMPH